MSFPSLTLSYNVGIVTVRAKPTKLLKFANLSRKSFVGLYDRQLDRHRRESGGVGHDLQSFRGEAAIVHVGGEAAIEFRNSQSRLAEIRL